MSVVHSVLPARLAAEVDGVLVAAAVDHVSHTGQNAVKAGAAAARDDDAVALIGPYRSRDVAETVEATAPAGLPLLAPTATWAGVTRDDEPGCEDDPARHGGTVFRLLARDTEVTARVAADLRAGERRALVVAGSSEYGVQLDAQLRLVGLPRAASAEDADLVVFCGLSDDRELELVRSCAPLPVVAFDGVQGADLEGDVQLALPYAPSSTLDKADVFAGVGQARAAAALVLEVLASGARDRASMLGGLRQLGRFDEHGDPLEPEVWLWRVGPGWTLEPSRPI